MEKVRNPELVRIIKAIGGDDTEKTYLKIKKELELHQMLYQDSWTNFLPRYSQPPMKLKDKVQQLKDTFGVKDK